MKQPSLAPLRGQLTLFLITRSIMNTGYRMIYPFLPSFARALGVDISAISLAITARSSLGIFGLLFGSAGDLIGRRSAMLVGIGFFAGGFILLLFWPTYPSLFITLLLGALGKIVFDPAMQAYIGDNVHYSLRGRAIAITEFGWSGASLVGLPIVGWLISRSGWIAPFPLLGLLSALACIFIWQLLPSDPNGHSIRTSLSDSLRMITSHPATLAALSVTFLVSLGNESINIVYGIWLESSFGLQVVALGAASAIIGFAELGGEGLVATLTDRMGKVRSLNLGLGSVVLACLVFPFLGRNLFSALIGLFLFYLSFEFTFVTLISFLTELAPSARATLMAGNLAAASGGRALGALIGPALFEINIMASSAFGAAMATIALAILITKVKVE